MNVHYCKILTSLSRRFFKNSNLGFYSSLCMSNLWVLENVKYVIDNIQYKIDHVKIYNLTFKFIPFYEINLCLFDSSLEKISN